MTHYRFVEFWSQKAWVFFKITWVFSKRGLSFQVFCDFSILEREICSKYTKYCIFLARFAQILGVLNFTISISLPVCWVFWVKFEITTGSLNFSPQRPWVFRFAEFFSPWVFAKVVKNKSQQYQNHNWDPTSQNVQGIYGEIWYGLQRLKDSFLSYLDTRKEKYCISGGTWQVLPVWQRLRPATSEPRLARPRTEAQRGHPRAPPCIKIKD